MQIEFVDLKRLNEIHKKEFMEAIEKVVDSTVFVEGDVLKEFEKSFAEFCNSSYAIGLNSGTDALFLIMAAHGIGKGDEIITAPNSYIATAMTASNLGATPVFADVDEKTFTLDPKLLEEKITPRTKAIIPVHLYGHVADMDPIIDLAKKHNLLIIEDCAQAHGTKYKEKRVPYTGTGIFSFYPSKNIGAFGDSGAIVTNDPEIKTKLEYLRNDGSVEKYVHKMMGYKSRLDPIQASVLLVKLKYIDDWNNLRRAAARKYDELLKNIPQIITPTEMPYAYHTYHLYPVISEKRNELKAFLEEQGVKTVIHYPIPIHLQEAYKHLGFKKGDFPITEKQAETTLSLPIFPYIKDEEIEYVCEKIKDFYEKQ